MPIKFHRDGPWDIPEGWVWARAGDVLPIEYGKGLPERVRDNTGSVPVYGSAGIVGTHISSMVDEPCLIIARKGSVGSVFEESRPCWPIDTVYFARHSPALDPRYAYWFINFAKLAKLDQSTAVPSLSRDKYNEVQMPFPPLAEQQRIAARIDELFTDIADGEIALIRARDDLDTWRRALLKAGVTGELTREWRERNKPNETGEALLNRIREGRNSLGRRVSTRRASRAVDELEQPHFDLPETWCSATWGEIGISQNGRPFPSNDYSDCGVKLLRPGNLYANGQVRWTETNTRYLPEHHLVDNPDLLVRGGELVINLTAQSLKDEFLGRVCITDYDEHCLLNQRLARLTPIETLPEFALLVFKSSLFRSFVRQLNSGSLIQHMFTSQIESFLFPLPPLEEQAAIVAAANHSLGAVGEMEDLGARGTETPGHLRQSILKAAFEGRIVEQDPRDEPAEVLLARSSDGSRHFPPPSSRRVRRACNPAARDEA
jgi:type I restriction enzyme, S subunit